MRGRLVALFISTFENKVDRKGRVSVPAPFRAHLVGQNFSGVIAYRSFNLPCIEGCDWVRMEDYATRIDQLAQGSDEAHKLNAIFSDSKQLVLDGEGRIVLPTSLLGHAGITETAIFVGVGRTFQIWSPERYQARESTLRERAEREGAAIPALQLLPGER